RHAGIDRFLNADSIELFFILLTQVAVGSDEIGFKRGADWRDMRFRDGASVLGHSTATGKDNTQQRAECHRKADLDPAVPAPVFAEKVHASPDWQWSIR